MKFSKLQFNQLLNSISHCKGVSIIHYVDENQHPHTLVAHSPIRTIYQTTPKNDPKSLVESSLQKNNTLWVIATSYEWGCHHIGITTPHTNALYIEYQDYLIINHKTNTAMEYGASLFPLNKIQPDSSMDIGLTPHWDAIDFSNAISKAQAAIKEGDIYQINLSYPGTVETAQSISDIYRYIHSKNTPRHGALIKSEHWGIASASPEELFFLKKGRIRTQPIKGTIGRHRDPLKDLKAQKELKHSAKDHAELVMITDLMRNDLSQFAKTGSVKTTSLCELIEFPYVYHLVSRVEADVANDTSALDILKQLAPGGSITGCPKKSACEYIANIESTPREFYTGHIGFITSHGEASFNVAIRTCYQINESPITTHAGCGITIDSDHQKEYQESLDKLKFLTDNIGVHA